MQGAEDMRQLKALTETIKPATSQTNQTTTDLTSMRTELHSLRIATSNVLHQLRTDLGTEAPKPQKSPTAIALRVPPLRMQ